MHLFPNTSIFCILLPNSFLVLDRSMFTFSFLSCFLFLHYYPSIYSYVHHFLSFLSFCGMSVECKASEGILRSDALTVKSPLPKKQAISTLQGMAQHKFSIIFNYQSFTLLSYLFGENHTPLLRNGMAATPKITKQKTGQINYTNILCKIFIISSCIINL